MQPPPPWPPSRPLPSMGQQSVATMMQQQQQQQQGGGSVNTGGGGKGNAGAGRSGYNQKALAEIRNSLLPFANSETASSGASTISLLSSTSGVSSASTCSNGYDSQIAHLLSMGYYEDGVFRGFKNSGNRLDSGQEHLLKQQQQQQNEPANGLCKNSSGLAFSNKLSRKPSLEREIHRGSPAATLDSGAGSSRSDSPRLAPLPFSTPSSGVGDLSGTHSPLSRQYSPSSQFSELPPPVPPPRCCSSSPPPPVPPLPIQSHAEYRSQQQQQFSFMSGGGVPSNMPQILKRMSPAPPLNQQPTRGTSPVGRQQPMVVHNGPQVQQQLTQQMQALNIFQQANGEPLPPYPIMPTASSPASTKLTTPPPSYSASIQARQSPTQMQDFRKSPSAMYSGITPGMTHVVTSSSCVATQASSIARPTALQAWGARQTKTQQPIIMQSVKSTQVQKPVLQTAIAPTAPPPVTAAPPPPPSYACSIQQRQQQQQTPPPQLPPYPIMSKPAAVVPQYATPATASPPTVSVPTTDPPSYAITMQALAAQRSPHLHLHPPPYPPCDDGHAPVSTVESNHTPRLAPSVNHQPLQRKYSPASSVPEHTNGTNNNETNYEGQALQNGRGNGNNNNGYKYDHESPIPERKRMSKEKEEERRVSKVRYYSPQAFKFYMEQHIENVMKSYQERMMRRRQLENEMSKVGLCPNAQDQMRKMLYQKESNYIRLKRAKMDKSMFTKIKVIGVGAFGEVALVRKIDTNHLYAMKTLRKADVLERNQVAHVKAERDILAEADNEWVVKLYYSFQDKDNLYFVMDYIPGGDLMSLLIKRGIFEEPLARFYIAELTCAVESVHKMGFIHRDIKPDNILIDKDGHIKLTDFGLCTGFRWTHNSKYYQRNGEHGRQDSMDPAEGWSNECRCNPLKPLERRRKREHQRCLAHSLVGTPNYIAPEVLLRHGYTQLCDWWSVGVILYEMLVGQPPFLANTPEQTQYKVINWENTLHIPDQAQLSSEAKDLTLKLCTSPERRLGKNATEVKAHPFFKKVDFDKGLRHQKAPYIPKLENPTDTSNFDPVDPDKLRSSGSSESGKSDGSQDISKPFHGFFEFTFRRFFDDGGGGPAYPSSRINSDDHDNNQGPVYV